MRNVKVSEIHFITWQHSRADIESAPTMRTNTIIADLIRNFFMYAEARVALTNTQTLFNEMQ